LSATTFNGALASSNLTGSTLPSSIVSSSLTSVGTITSGVWNGTAITNTYLANSAITINGTSTSLGGSINVGTVTSVTGTAPVVSSGGNTPAISMAAATTAVNGYLTSTDWTTFNGKQDLLISGTNIKTINGSSVLGSGNLVVSASAGGATTQVQYNNAGAFAGNANFTYTGNDVNIPYGPSNTASSISRVALAISMMS
jgi:hypothetical protein